MRRSACSPACSTAVASSAAAPSAVPLRCARDRHRAAGRREPRRRRRRVSRDLYAQLAVLPLRVPPLREYAEDVPELLRHCIDQLTEAEQLPFRRCSVAAQNRLRNYPWPDNLRELRNLVRRLLLRGGARGDLARGSRARAGARRRPTTRRW